MLRLQAVLPAALFALLTLLTPHPGVAGEVTQPLFRDGFEGEFFPPILQPIANQQASLGTTWRLRAVGSSEQVNAVLRFEFLQAPPGAAVVEPEIGLLQWTPTATGRFDFVLQLSDRGLGFDQQEFSIDVVDPGNRPPRLLGLADLRTPALQAFSLQLQAEDDDLGDSLVFELIAAPSGMILTGDTLTWTPELDQLGPHTVAVLVRDSAAATDAGSFVLNVDANQPPLAIDDHYEVRVGQTLEVPASFGVLANDVDPEQQPLSAQLLTSPGLGSLLDFASDGGFRFRAPDSDPFPPPAPMIYQRGPRLDEIYAPGLAADINGDGFVDAVYSFFNNGQTAISGADGSALWVFDRSGAQDCFDWLAGDGGRVLADIDDSGSIAFVYPTACNNAVDELLALNNQGNLKWRSPRLSKPHPDSVVASGPNAGQPLPFIASLALHTSLGVARLRPQDPPRLLLRKLIQNTNFTYFSGPANANRNAGCRGATGREEDEAQACRATLLIDGSNGSVVEVLAAPNPTGEGTAGVANASPAQNHAPLAVDLDGDGVVEIVSGSDVWKQDADGAWSLHWQTEREPATLAVADLDGDGLAEVVHIRYENAVNSPHSGILIYRHDGSLLRRIPYTGWRLSHLSIADVDGDGVPEILAAADGRLEAIRPDGTRLWTHVVPEFEPPVGGGAPSYPSIAQALRVRNGNINVYDLDGDGVVEVLLASIAGVEIVDGRSGASKARVFHYGWDARPLVHVLDIDGDGHTELLSINTRSCGAPAAFCNTPVFIRGNQPWLPGPRIVHQINYQPGQIAAGGTVLHDPVVPRSYRVPVQLGEQGDPQQIRTTRFEYLASDGGADSAPATVSIRIPPENLPPVFTSRPPRAVRMAVAPATYPASAFDPEGGPVTYRLIEPTGSNLFNLDPTTGELQIITCCGSSGQVLYGEGSIVFIAIEASDALGAVASQGFTVRMTSQQATVPDVLGLSYPAALATLQGADLFAYERAAIHDASPAGTVIGQDPLPAATGIPVQAEVGLTVSLGPEPIIVPNLVGLGEASAATSLAQLGFSLLSPQREFDLVVPAGEVLAQDPPAGTRVVPGSARLTVSAGSGLALRLSRQLSTVDVPIEVTLVATDVNGQPVAPPAVVWSIVAADPLFADPAPSFDAGRIVFPALARGAFTLTATEPGSGRSASSRFAVHHAEPPGQTSNAGEFARYSAVLEELFTLRDALVQAHDADDEPAMRAILADMLVVWRSFDVLQVLGSAPVAPDNGFPLRAADLAAQGFTPTAQDVLYKQVLREAAADAGALLEAWRAPQTSVAELSELDTRLQQRARRLAGLSPSIYGLVDGIPELHVLLAARLPRTLDQMFDEIELLLTGAPGKVSPRSKSTLPEVLTSIAVNKIVESLSSEYQRFKKEAFFYAGWTTAVVALTAQVRSSVDAGTAEAVVSGPSLSIRVFGAPWAMIEGAGYELDYPDLNEVLIVGPNIAFVVEEAIEKFKEGYRFFQDIDPDLHFTNFDQLKKQYREIKQKMIDSFVDPTQAIVDEARSMYQPPIEAERGCIFAFGPCTQMLYPDGFKSVYSLPPDAFLPLPTLIVILVLNPVTGAATLDLVPFLPTVREP
ncbi:MAG: PASTA domain-containing protein [Porticoccaceae bacterium]